MRCYRSLSGQQTGLLGYDGPLISQFLPIIMKFIDVDDDAIRP